MAVVRTSDEARDLLMAWCKHHGITLSGLLQSLARNLPTDPLDERQRFLVEEARAIDVEGRDRS